MPTTMEVSARLKKMTEKRPPSIGNVSLAREDNTGPCVSFAVMFMTG